MNYLKKEREFTANPLDPEPHGREIYRRCLVGEFGAIRPPIQAEIALEIDKREITDTYQESYAIPGWSDALHFVLEANKEVSSGTLRGITLVWSSMIERMLGSILEAFLIDHGSSKELIWKTANGPLTSFSSRSSMAFALGLISSAEFGICEKIRKIRNIVAHEWNISLENMEIRQRIIGPLRGMYDLHHAETFEWIEDIDFLITMIYGASCGALAMELARRHGEALAARRIQRANPEDWT